MGANAQVDLGKLSPTAQYLGFVINSYQGHELNDVKNTSCHLYETATKVRLERA